MKLNVRGVSITVEDVAASGKLYKITLPLDHSCESNNVTAFVAYWHEIDDCGAGVWRKVQDRNVAEAIFAFALPVALGDLTETKREVEKGLV
jgi:hypothetical protein